MEESLGLGKKSSGAETDTETWSWFRLPIPKLGFGRTLIEASPWKNRKQLKWVMHLETNIWAHPNSKIVYSVSK